MRQWIRVEVSRTILALLSGGVAVRVLATRSFWREMCWLMCGYAVCERLLLLCVISAWLICGCCIMFGKTKGYREANLGWKWMTMQGSGGVRPCRGIGHKAGGKAEYFILTPEAKEWLQWRSSLPQAAAWLNEDGSQLVKGAFATGPIADMS
jgi:hypothetical protein